MNNLCACDACLVSYVRIHYYTLSLVLSFTSVYNSYSLFARFHSLCTKSFPFTESSEYMIRKLMHENVNILICPS